MLEPREGVSVLDIVSVHTKLSVEIFGRKFSMFVRFSWETFSLSLSPSRLCFTFVGSSRARVYSITPRALVLSRFLTRRDARLAISFCRHFGPHRVAARKICNSIEKPEVGNAGRQCEITPGYTLPIKC